MKNNIFTEREMHARHEILLETFTKKLQIESRVMGDLTGNLIIPTAIFYQNKLIENVRGLRDLGLDKKLASAQLSIIEQLSQHISDIKKNVDMMIEERKKANRIPDARERAIVYDERVKSHFDQIRYNVDKLELLVNDSEWPLPKFRELLFIK